MNAKDIAVGQEYAVRRGSYGECQRVRVLEAAKVAPARAPTVWSKHSPVVLPGEANYARLEGKARRHFRCEGVGGDLCYLGGLDSRGRRWLPPQRFISTWADYEAEVAAASAARAQTQSGQEAQQAAWEPLMARLIGVGLLKAWEARSLPDRDALDLTVNREQAARILAALEREAL